MKRILAMILVTTMLFCITAQTAFAEDLEKVMMGETYTVTDTFYNGKEEVLYGWTTYDYTVSARYTKNGKYVEQPFIDDSDNSIQIRVKPSTELTSTQTVEGTVTIYDKQERKRYTAQVKFQVGPGQYLYLTEVADKEFILPGSYNYGVIRCYDVDTKNKYGTLNAEFISNDDARAIAYFDVKIAEQGNMILSHNEKPIMDIVKKSDAATMRFIAWDATPKFDATGTLGIVMESDEYLYKIGAENKLTAVTGKYNTGRGTFDFKTNTLGAYVISDVKLSASAASGEAESSSSVAASVAPPASSSKPAASSVAPPPASSSKPAASSSKPASSSAAPAPSSSSSEPESSSSSEPESSSSEPEPSSESKPESSSTATVPEKDKDEDKGGFPIMPVAIGLGVVVVGGVAAYFIFNNRSGGKKKNYDSWDD